MVSPLQKFSKFMFAHSTPRARGQLSELLDRIYRTVFINHMGPMKANPEHVNIPMRQSNYPYVVSGWSTQGYSLKQDYLSIVIHVLSLPLCPVSSCTQRLQRPWLWTVSWWRHQMETFPRNWPFVRGIHRSPVNSPHKGQWRGDLMFSLIIAWINAWVNNGEAGGLSRNRAHYDVTVMMKPLQGID